MTSAATSPRADRTARSIDITDLRTRRLDRYVRRQREVGDVHIERRGGRAYLVADASPGR